MWTMLTEGGESHVVHGWDEAKVMNGHKTGGREAGDMVREKKEMRIKRDTKIATQTAKI